MRQRIAELIESLVRRLLFGPLRDQAAATPPPLSVRVPRQADRRAAVAVAAARAPEPECTCPVVLVCAPHGMVVRR